MREAFEIGLCTLTGNKNCSILLAVSGGVDSMVMASLFVSSAYKKLALAHMNFGLRGQESDADEALVCHWAQERGLPFYVRKVETPAYAAEHGLSIEMAARELRYQWFETLRQELHMDYIALAHNANDHAETMILHLIRGSGIRGLCGIPAKRDRLIRPMLGFERPQIEEFARNMHVPYREDASNADLQFSRNRIRHVVLPELAKINPAVVARMQENSAYLQQARLILEEQTEARREAWILEKGDALLLDVEKVRQDRYAAYWLFELLRPYGFESAQIKQVMRLLEAGTGKKILSRTHVLYRDREQLALVPLTRVEATGTLADQCAVSLHKAPMYMVKKDSRIAALDADKLQFPLTLRVWRDGDRFIPFGMSGFKKVSDFLIDIKMPLWEKERQRVLCSGEDIVWLVGKRIDERYKITAQTENVAEVCFTAY